MQSTQPLLVIVSGAPGTGKTTLARRLSTDLALRLLSKDQVKESLADALGDPETVAASSILGAGAYAAMYAMARAWLGSGVGVVLESNFRHGLSESEIVIVGTGTDIRVVHCAADTAVIDQRYRDRATQRHAAHLDAARHEDVIRDLADGAYEPLGLDAPLLVVRTDDGYGPTYEEVRAFVSAAPA